MKKVKQKKSIRLPSHIKPIKYNLTLKPDLKAFVFSGQEIIDIIIEKETRQITLHAKDIDIETCTSRTGTKIQFASKISYDIKNETATFYFKDLIPKGKAKLSIVFSGIINDSLRGFYRSKYHLNGEEKYLATTQFEATDARQAFPCFDEPAHKAIFEVSLIIPEHHTAISNTLPIKIEKHEAGLKIVDFSPSPKMSTYLLAFITGEFEYVERYVKAKSNSPLANKFSGPRMREDEEPDHENLFANSESTLVRVFTTPRKKHQAKFALEVAIKSLKFYNEYFDIPYPLPTLDLIAIPDFESGAMENWGAVTFRETAILVDEEHSSLKNKQWVALVIAHELAHQWFGNLVTMHWWTDLWLNEGFASYIEYLAIDHIFPNWKIWNQFLISDHNIALSLDGLNNSHPIEITVHHPDEINEIFDKISYSKGASIIRMLAFYLGEEKFRDGLRYYLKKHSYKNTETVDLWKAFEKISKEPVGKIMDTWTKQTGYPLISVSSRSDLCEIKQERFFSSRVSRKENKIENLWQIPVDLNNSKILLTKKLNELQGKVIDKINKGENSFIRVKYNNETLDHLKEQILTNRLTTSDRLGIIRDIFALTEGGYISTITALEFSLSYKNANEYIVWSEIASGINKIYNLIPEELFVEKYKKYALELFSPLVEKMGWNKEENEKHSDVFLRSLVISQAGFYGDKKVIRDAKKLFNGNNKIEANLRSVIYSIVARNGKEKEWKQFERLYKKEVLPEEEDRYGYALTRFQDKDLLNKTLEFILSENVRNQDTPHLIAYTWQNEYGRDLVWEFIKKNWSVILKKYGEGGHFLSRLLSPLGNHIKTKDLIDAKKFFSKNPAPGADRALKQAYEKIESNIAWIKDDKKDIENWLNINY